MSIQNYFYEALFFFRKEIFNAPSCLTMCRFWQNRRIALCYQCINFLEGLFCSEKVLKDFGVVEIMITDKTRISSKFRVFIELNF